MSKSQTREPKLTNRAELIQALQSASEIEHLLCCEYLYAGFSVRRTLGDFEEAGDESRRMVLLDRVRPWLSQVNMIARQEMEHLAIATNLLAAVGGEPHLERPNFPIPANASLLQAPLCLDRFGPTSLRRFVWYERPEHLTPPFAPSCCDVEIDPGPPHAMATFGIHSIQALYEEILAAFETLPPQELFVGNTDRQLGPVFAYRVDMVPITNRSDAAAAVFKILEQGEGIGANPLHSDSHFQRFTQILRECDDLREREPELEPSLPVLTNPRFQPGSRSSAVSFVTRPETVAVMRFFGECYHTMLVMLKTFFATYSTAYAGTTFPESRPQAAMIYAAFFPLMTMVIRPVGEVLARMPAGDTYPGRTAGASFELDSPVVLQTDPEWYGARLTHLAESARNLADAVPPRLREDMLFLHQNLFSTRQHLHTLWTKGQ
jgi:Ferritin-like